MASAKQNRMKKLVEILEDAGSWTSTSALCKMLGTSERSIRNYVTELNETGNAKIESSKEGYRLVRQAGAATVSASPYAPLSAQAETRANELRSDRDSRRNYVISRLVNAHEPVSLFDIADELFISESTLASGVMPYVRKLLSEFDLSCESHDFMVELSGREQDKRRLLGHIATHSTYGYFASTKTLEDLFPTFDVHFIQSKLVEICQRTELFINDYALSNLLVHLLVIVIRLTSNNELPQDEGPIDAEALVAGLKQKNEIVRCAKRISKFFEEEYGCTIPDADYRQILMLLALSVERLTYSELNLEKLASVINQNFVDTVLRILDDASQRYGIDGIGDEQMRLQLVLHMYNAYQRATYHVSYPNPLTQQIKSEYAPIYDMAVYISHCFGKVMGIELSENEIAFIAFHIGTYFERSGAPANNVSCIVIVEEYHDFAQRLVDDIKRSLAEELTVIGVMSCDAYLMDPPESDVVITTVDLPIAHNCKILIGPILTQQNLRKIRDRIAGVLENKRQAKAKRFLRSMLEPELFARNAPVSCADEAINYLGELCIAADVADEAYIADVRTREQVSSTAFTKHLAVPHSISVFPKRSFIAVMHNDTPIAWGRHSVNFALLIGIAQEEMPLFRDTLDLIIDAFGSVDDTTRLLKTDSFEEFVLAFTQDIT